MPEPLCYLSIYMYDITNDLYNLNFIALDTKLTELDKLISKFWNNCQYKFLENILVEILMPTKFFC